MPLRLKLVLALLLTSLAAVALVGGLSYVRVSQRLDSLRAEQAEHHFRSQVAAYLARYGSWQQGQAQLPFHQFMGRRGPPGEGPNGPPRPDEGGPRSGEEVPYRFILTDADYRVLLGGGRYEDGHPLPLAARAQARPVYEQGRIVAYVSAEGVLAPSAAERQFLATLREALLLGAVGGAALALLLGLWMAGRLSRTVRSLTQAVQAMADGQLDQQVASHGHDEVARLARAFNQMSSALAQSQAAQHRQQGLIEQQAARLRELSQRDGLTGLYNRRHFDEQAPQLLAQARRHGRPLSVLMLDVDWFKQINDRFSHAVGDAVLRQLGDLLAGALRQPDLLARYGGEEFIVLLPDTTLAQARELGERLRAQVAAFAWTGLHPELRVTISLGLSADPQATLAGLQQQADARLYQAKAGGRNQLCCA